MNNKTIQNNQRLVLSLFGGFAACLLAVVLLLPGGLLWNYPVLLSGGAGLLVGSVPLMLYKRKTTAFFDEMQNALAAMQKGDDTASLPSSQNYPPESVISRFLEGMQGLFRQQTELRRQAHHDKTALQSLVSDISHQVKTPLANMQISLGLVADSSLPPAQRSEFAASAGRSLATLEFLLDALVKMSRLETGSITLGASPQNVYDMLANCVGAVMLKAQEKNIAINVNCPTALTALFDAKWTGEAVFNLLDNAVKYTPQGGQIFISGEQWECYTKITIGDTGPGIPESEQAKVFARFYRGQQTAGQAGAGLGLTLARNIITRQNGYIKLENSGQPGAVFSVFLPV